MYERRHQKIASRSAFAKRMIAHIEAAAFLSAVALFLGISGYPWIAGLGRVDSLLEASMILDPRGVGLVNTLTTTGAKLFSSGYALFSGLMFIALMRIVLSRVIHRLLRAFMPMSGMSETGVANRPRNAMA